MPIEVTPLLAWSISIFRVSQCFVVAVWVWTLYEYEALDRPLIIVARKILETAEGKTAGQDRDTHLNLNQTDWMCIFSWVDWGTFLCLVYDPEKAEKVRQVFLGGVMLYHTVTTPDKNSLPPGPGYSVFKRIHCLIVAEGHLDSNIILLASLLSSSLSRRQRK